MTWLGYLGEWFQGWHGAAATFGRILLIVVLTVLAQRLASRVIRTFRIRIAARMTGAEQVRRAETLGRAFRYLAAVIISLIGAVLVLAECGVSVAPILGAAGVVGLAVGFGAQSLVKDYFTGMFLLLENQIIAGDVVEIAGKSGLVEDLTLRYVRLRDYDGNVHFVPNGLISTVTNMSRGFAYAVIDVGIAYREETDRVVDVMRSVGAAIRADETYGEKIVESFEVAGVERLDDSAVVLRGRFKVKPLEQWNVRREYLRRLKQAFDAAGIEIPFPQLTVHRGVGGKGEADPLSTASREA